MRSFISKLALLITLILCQHASNAESIVLYGVGPNQYSSRALKLALSYIPDKNYEIAMFPIAMPKRRALENMGAGKGIHVVFGGANTEREENYLPIRFPLLRGLNGWRVPLIHKDTKHLFDDIETLDELKKLAVGQFHSCSDTLVLESNNLNVVKGSNYPALYHMLDKKRFDYFPRSVLEVESDYEGFKHLDIKINYDILIYYPTAYYFYVAKENVDLANEIERGLWAAFNDGTLETLYMEFYGETIENFRKKKPKVFRLTNKFLSEQTPLDKPELWIDLEVKN